MKQEQIETLIKQRVISIIRDRKITASCLAREYGMNQRTIFDQFSTNTKIAAATLVALADYCKDIPGDYLLGRTESYTPSIDSHDEATDHSVIQKDNKKAKVTYGADEKLLQWFQDKIDEKDKQLAEKDQLIRELIFKK